MKVISVRISKTDFFDQTGQHLALHRQVSLPQLFTAILVSTFKCNRRVLTRTEFPVQIVFEPVILNLRFFTFYS